MSEQGVLTFTISSPAPIDCSHFQETRQFKTEHLIWFHYHQAQALSVTFVYLVILFIIPPKYGVFAVLVLIALTWQFS